MNSDDRVKQGGHAIVLLTAAIALSTGCAALGLHDPDQVISMNELPVAVRSPAEKETAGCTIIEVEKEMKDGRVIYAITYDRTGEKLEVEYAQDGTLLSKDKE